MIQDKINPTENIYGNIFKMAIFFILLSIGMMGCNCQRNEKSNRIDIERNSDFATVKINNSMEMTLIYDEEGVLSFKDSDDLGMEIRATISRSGKKDSIIIVSK